MERAYEILRENSYRVVVSGQIQVGVVGEDGAADFGEFRNAVRDQNSL